MTSFCGAPFNHLYIKQGGKYTTCCVSDTNFVDINNKTIDDTSIEEVWNSDYIKDIRLQLLHNKEIESCHNCTTQEKLGNPNPIKQNFNKKISLLRLKEAKDNNGQLNRFPNYIGWQPSNTCNLNCIMCSPHNSSTWEKNKDIYPSIKFAVSNKTNNLESIKKFIPHINELYIAGGEPTITVNALKLLRYCIEYGYAENIHLRFSTNFTLYNPKFTELLPKFKKISVNISLDSYGEVNDWVRVPSKWSIIENNFNKWDSISNMNFVIGASLSIYSILYLPRLFKWRNNNKKLFSNIGIPNIKLSSVVRPVLTSPYNLPKDLKDKFKEDMMKVEPLNIYEARSIPLYINEIINSSVFYDDYDRWLTKLQKYTKDIDKRFNLDSKKTFPELTFLHEKI